MALMTGSEGEKNGGQHVRPLNEDEFSVTRYGEKCHSDLAEGEECHSDLGDGQRCHSLKGKKDHKSNGNSVEKCRSDDCDADICRSDVLDGEKCDIDRFRDMTNIEKCRGNDRFGLENEKRRKVMHSTLNDVDVTTLPPSYEQQVSRLLFMTSLKFFECFSLNCTEPSRQCFLSFFAPWTPKSQKTSTDSKTFKVHPLNTCKRDLQRVQYFTFVIFADPQDPLYGPPVKNLCFKVFQDTEKAA